MVSPLQLARAMRSLLAVVVTWSAACSSPHHPGVTPADAAGGDDAAARPSVWDSVDGANLQARLLELTGGVSVTVNGATFAITNRWSVAAKTSFRAYWTEYFAGLGATVNVLEFPIANLIGETKGHNVEAIFPGRSTDTVVVITHYDTVGITGQETKNPGADDAGSGLAMEMEAARIFAQYSASERAYTVRFVAADYEEISNNLDGDYAYVSYLQAQAQADGFKILVASDGDQTGWSCWSENLCGAHAPAANTTFQMISCSGDSNHYAYPDLATGIADVASAHASTVTPTALCDGSGDTDHYPFWVAGIPAYVIEEYGSANNPHYDDTGGDTMAHIDLDLLTATARIQIAFQARLAGIGS